RWLIYLYIRIIDVCVPWYPRHTMQKAFVLAIVLAGLLAYPVFSGFPVSLSNDSSSLVGEISTNTSEWDSADVETSDTHLHGLHAQAFTLTELVVPSAPVFLFEGLIAETRLQVQSAPWLLRSLERGPPHSQI